MTRKKQLFTVFAVLMMVASVFVGAGAAADFVADDGESVTAESPTPLQLTVGDEGNITLQMTEDQTGGTSYFYNTSGEAESLDVTMSSGTLSGTRITADGFYVNTSATSDTVGAVNATFDQTTNESESGIYTGQVMSNESYLIEDPDASETVDYVVVDTYAEQSYSVHGLDASFNQSEGELMFDETGRAQFMIDLNRSNTTFESYGLDTLRYEVWVNTTYFQNIEYTGDTSASTVVKVDEMTEDGYKKYVLAVQNPDNTTAEYWDDVAVAVNATAVGGDVNETFVVKEVHDPTSGGPEAGFAQSYDHGAGAAATTGDFGDGPLGIPIWAWALGLGAVGIVLVVGTRGQGESSMNNGYAAKAEAISPSTVEQSSLKVVVGLAGLVIGLGMVLGPFVGFDMLAFGLGLPVRVLVGFVIVALTGGWSLMETR